MTDQDTPTPSAGHPDESPESELARFFEYSPDVLAIIGRDGRVIMVSPSARQLLGHSSEELVGHPYGRFILDVDRRSARGEVRMRLPGGSMSDVEARVRRAEGGWVPMRWSLSLGPDGRVYAVGRDSTESARAQKALLRQELAQLRLRTAMEIHDGVLQTLTGASLHINVARRLVANDPSSAQGLLDSLAELISAEQREIRLYVDEVKGELQVWPDAPPLLEERIETIIKRVGAIWGVSTSVDLRLPDGIPDELSRQILRIAQEATVNAARHGGAKAISVIVALDGAWVSMIVADDGVGFSFLGEYDDESLRTQRLGPLSLKHRVDEAEGKVSIHSTREGSRVTVRLPLPIGGPE